MKKIYLLISSIFIITQTCWGYIGNSAVFKSIKPGNNCRILLLGDIHFPTEEGINHTQYILAELSKYHLLQRPAHVLFEGISEDKSKIDYLHFEKKDFKFTLSTTAQFIKYLEDCFSSKSVITNEWTDPRTGSLLKFSLLMRKALNEPVNVKFDYNNISKNQLKAEFDSVMSSAIDTFTKAKILDNDSSWLSKSIKKLLFGDSSLSKLISETTNLFYQFLKTHENIANITDESLKTTGINPKLNDIFLENLFDIQTMALVVKNLQMSRDVIVYVGAFHINRIYQMMQELSSKLKISCVTQPPEDTFRASPISHINHSFYVFDNDISSLHHQEMNNNILPNGNDDINHNIVELIHRFQNMQGSKLLLNLTPHTA